MPATASVEYGEEAVDLEFIRGLPPDSVFGLSLSDVVPASFAAVAHLAPGLRGLGVYLDNLGDDAPSVIAELTALESLRLYGDDDGPGRPGDHALSTSADLPALEYLALLGGSSTEHGLQQLRRHGHAASAGRVDGDGRRCWAAKGWTRGPSRGSNRQVAAVPRTGQGNL